MDRKNRNGGGLKNSPQQGGQQLFHVKQCRWEPGMYGLKICLLMRMFLNEEELDFIINYNIKYHISGELEGEG
jgi:hypothetical protein